MEASASDGPALSIVELLRSTGEREFPAQLMSIFFWVTVDQSHLLLLLIMNIDKNATGVKRIMNYTYDQGL